MQYVGARYGSFEPIHTGASCVAHCRGFEVDSVRLGSARLGSASGDRYALGEISGGPNNTEHALSVTLSTLTTSRLWPI